MKLNVRFEENDNSFKADFGEINNISDGGYERGYEKGYSDGYKVGYSEGETKGKADGEAIGYEKGYTVGHTEGQSAGYKSGYDVGYADGYAKGKADGYAEGHTAGYTEGRDVGHSEGYTEGKQDGITEGYASGKADGVQEGYASGVTDGKKSEYDTFWDEYQQNGERWYYLSAFAGTGWYQNTMKPKYPIAAPPTRAMNATEMFFHHNESRQPYDFVAHCKEHGIVFDFSGVDYLVSTFAYACISTLGVVDLKSVLEAYGTYATGGAFMGCYVTSIEKIVFYETNPEYNNNMFQNCTRLTEIRFEGTLAKNGLNFQWSPLSHESLVSLIGILKDYSTDTSGTTHKVIIGTANYAKLTDEDKANITAKGWIFE